MDKKIVAILAGASLLGGEAVGEIDKHGLHWMAAADHNHIEIHEGITVGVSSPISASGQAVALRAILKKAGSPDVRFELHRTESVDFSVIENGEPTGVFWFEITPQEAMSGDVRVHTLHEAWQKCLAKRYPEYAITNLEEGFPGARSSKEMAVDSSHGL
jgi:hypothetical protein